MFISYLRDVYLYFFITATKRGRNNSTRQTISKGIDGYRYIVITYFNSMEIESMSFCFNSF